jgi:two-component sensor histidine kinase/PAS domain-containing protein
MERLVGIADRTRAWPLWARLGGAALLLGAALATRFALAGAESGYPYLTFFAAVLLAAVLFGRRVGLLVTAAATALAVWFFVRPVGSLRVDDPRDAWAALAFAATGLAFVLLASAARRALRERDRANAALRLVLEGIGEPFYVLDADWRFVHASRAALRAWGKTAPEVLGRRYIDPFPEGAGGPIHAAHEEVMRTRRPARLQTLSLVPGRWVEVDIHPAPDGGLSVAFRDINRRRLAEERQRLLVAELTHRIKNTLALVLAVADQTRRSVSSPDAFHAVFRDRLAALARAHDALRRDGETGTTLEAVAREALAPYGAGRAGAGAGAPRVVVVGGPEVRLSSGAAVALGMALHELATNAAKHGALSVPGGRVRLSWDDAEAGADGARWHEVLWEEAGGPSIPEPPSRRGFGTRLLERGLAAQIGGAVSLDFAATGLRCRIRLPADDRHGDAGRIEPATPRAAASDSAGAGAT